MITQPVSRDVTATGKIQRCRRVSAGLVFGFSIALSTLSMAQDISPARLMLSNATTPPVTTPSGNGYLDKLYREWFSRAGFRAELIVAPSERGLVNANAGIYDGDMARTEVDVNTLYPELIRVPEVLFQVVVAGVIHDKSIRISRLEHFRHYRVGYVRGWKLSEYLFDGEANAIAVRDIDALMEMLENKRIEVAFMGLATAALMASEKDSFALYSTEFRVIRNQYLYLHSRHRDKIGILTDTLKQMKADGSYDDIMAGYDAAAM